MLANYTQQLRTEKVRFDPHQFLVLLQLQRLNQSLNSEQATRGIYICGQVGRGKTMLMNHFFAHCSHPQKIRLHYHHFMRRVHQELNQITGIEDPLAHIANAWARQYRVICLDEFFVEDMGDAMLLARLWQGLFAAGVTLVTTSNSQPQDLYKNGLGRDRFLPMIALLEEQCELAILDHPTDYRRLQVSSNPFYWVTSTPSSAVELEEIKRITGSPLESNGSLLVLGRDIDFLWRSQQGVVFSFAQLCEGPRSQRDYIELARMYRVLAVTDVPCFDFIPAREIVHGVEETYQREHIVQHRSTLDDAARRFMALIDECYEQQCLVLITSCFAIDELYQGRELATPFARCASRLHEMQTWAPPALSDT